jgi:hypothetical protein
MIKYADIFEKMKSFSVLFAISIALMGTSPALALDPFASPPKNMAAPTGEIKPQNVTPNEITAPPPPPAPGMIQEEGALEIPTGEVIIEISGKLMINDILADDGLNNYILQTETEEIELNTAKDLDMFVGQNVTVYTEEVDGTLSIRSLTISEKSVNDFLDSVIETERPPEEEFEINPEETTKTASTGPSMYIIGAALLFVLFFGVALAMKRQKKAAPIETPQTKDDTPFEL